MNKKLVTILVSILTYVSVSAQFVARMEIKEHIEGICDEKEVYALFPSLKGQIEAVCPSTKEQILAKLNSDVTFLKDKPKYKDKGMVNIIINCKGKVVQCVIDNKTKSPELDKQIVAVFAALGEWKAGSLDGKEVDSSRLFSFKIKKGQFTWD